MAGSNGGSSDRVSVVICTRDRAAVLPHSLQALRAQTDRDFELVIVDNAPSDGRTREVVRAEWPEAVYVVEPVPGLPHARNRGVEAASGDVIAFTDDDCRPVPEWLASIRAAFAGEPAAGAVTGPIRPLELGTPAQKATESRGGFERGQEWVVHRPDERPTPVYPVQAWMFGAGANMTFRRAGLEATGAFDPAMSCAEDIDMLYRVVRAGAAIVYNPGAVVLHDHVTEWRQLRRRMLQWGWGYLTLLDKIARRDSPEYRCRACAERRGWLRYQLCDRLLPALRGRADVPLSLVILEFVGGLLGYRGYPLAERLAERRASESRSLHTGRT